MDEEYDMWDESSTPSPNLALQLALYKALATTAQPLHLETLTLQNVITVPHLIYHTPTFSNMLASLKSLRLECLSNVVPNAPLPSPQFCEFWETTLPEAFLTPVQTSLTLLVLHSDQYGAEPSFENVKFPNLSSISLGHFLLTGEPNAGVDGIIQRHIGTLQSIELVDCAIDLGDVTDDLDEPLLWATVFDDLTTLPALSQVNVHWTNSGKKYVQSGFGYHGVPPTMIPEADELDDASMEKLQTILSARRNSACAGPAILTIAELKRA